MYMLYIISKSVDPVQYLYINDLYLQYASTHKNSRLINQRKVMYITAYQLTLQQFDIGSICADNNFIAILLHIFYIISTIYNFLNCKKTCYIFLYFR